MKRKPFYIAIIASMFLFSCVSKKEYLKLQKENEANQTELKNAFGDCEKENHELANKLKACKDDDIRNQALLQNEENKNRLIEQQLDYFKRTNTNLLDRLADLSVVSKTGAESIKKSLEALNDQSKYIKDLTSSIQRKDSINLVLVMNLKRSLNDINDEDITIEVKKGVVYISLSDKMLFKSGSSEISSNAENVLSKIAKIINDQKDLDILVEGHTDNVPINTSCMIDNWDLSVKRATSVVRTLQLKYGVKPERMTAGGRSEYVPKTTNATTEGKSINRRTEIIILPKLDQFFQLLEPIK